jgi:hypothetical protein
MSDRKTSPGGRRKPGRTRLPSTETLLREKQALELRRGRATYEQIATQLQYASPSGAYEAVQRALGRISQGNVEEFRREERDMLDRLHLAWWPLALQGNEKAARVILSLSERRSRLLGLDAALAVHATITDAVDAKIEELVAELGEVAAAEAVHREDQ